MKGLLISLGVGLVVVCCGGYLALVFGLQLLGLENR